MVFCMLLIFSPIHITCSLFESFESKCVGFKRRVNGKVSALLRVKTFDIQGNIYLLTFIFSRAEFSATQINCDL